MGPAGQESPCLSIKKGLKISRDVETEGEGEGRRDGAKVGRAGRDFCLVPEEEEKKHRSLCLGFYFWIGVHNCAVRAPHCRMYQGRATLGCKTCH